MGTPDGPDAALAIRAAVEGDVTKIVEIERACFADPWSAISFVRVLREQHSRLAVAVRDGGIVGYSVATYVADEGELGNIAVIPHAQGHGIGRALLAAALREGWTRGAANVYLEVRASNADAQASKLSRFGRPLRAMRRRGAPEPAPEPAAATAAPAEGV
jgi:ribosomal-protein-alanine N-acetyltransferase